MTLSIILSIQKHDPTVRLCYRGMEISPLVGAGVKLWLVCLPISQCCWCVADNCPSRLISEEAEQSSRQRVSRDGGRTEWAFMFVGMQISGFKRISEGESDVHIIAAVICTTKVSTSWSRSRVYQNEVCRHKSNQRPFHSSFLIRMMCFDFIFTEYELSNNQLIFI